MKCSQLVKKRVVLAALLGLTCLTGQSLKGITLKEVIEISLAEIPNLSPQEAETAARMYFISMLGVNPPQISYKNEFVPKMIALLKATQNPCYTVLIQALEETRNCNNAMTIINKLRRDSVTKSIPEDFRAEVVKYMTLTQICCNISAALKR